jgi:oxygen-independent coproporphyrinogen-3 oxidase
MEALVVQLNYELKRFCVEFNSIESVFIGGGTPSTVEPTLYQPLFDTLKPYLKKGIEITSEANPNSATNSWLKGMYDLGINRISFGTQSFNDKKLKLLNRAHSAKQAKKSIINAFDVGFKNISLDLIYATFGDTKELLMYDLKTAFALPINHISAYALTIEENTPFYHKPTMAEEKLELTNFVFDTIKQNNFIHYEISNFGTYKSIHNLGYWSYKDYIGLGSGAVGKYNLQRFYPNTTLEQYIKNPLLIDTESLTLYDKKTEQIFLGLRSCVGIDIDILDDKELKKATILLKEGKLYKKNKTLFNPNYLLADEIALYIID